MTIETATTETVQGYLDLDGVHTYYEALGSGPPLVLLHGGMCPIETWAGLVPQLSSAYRVFTPERRGHGRTSDPGTITYENMASDTIAEIDVTRYDIRWWREHWKRTRTQGVVINAGGIVAYYPTEVPLHRRSEFLGERDLFGELARAAHDDGIVVFARMDSNGAAEAMYRAHPDWFTRKADGQPYFRDETLYAPCINGPYYREHIPAILREIASPVPARRVHRQQLERAVAREHLLLRRTVAHASRRRAGSSCQRGATGMPTAYRAWVEWSYACRLEIWDLYNAAARDAGGPECLWVGMIGGTLSGAAGAFRDYREICRRAKMIMLDSQRRSDATGFQANGQTGKLVHGLLGWDKLAPESMALYHTAGVSFRLTSRPEPEVRLWAVEAFAGGIQPWWHYVNAYHEDRRMYDTPLALSDWYVGNERFLHRRERQSQPLASSTHNGTTISSAAIMPTCSSTSRSAGSRRR